MWKDVRTKMDKFRESKLIRSLLENRSEFTGEEAVGDNLSSDEAYAEGGKIYLPISADSSQYSAVVDSMSKSFVLHGPPGTGKSQTITNMIANNIANGRRVLFVAEKMAALSVVYKRLKDIGIGDFCLELYSEKTKKSTSWTSLYPLWRLPDRRRQGTAKKTAVKSARLFRAYRAKWTPCIPFIR